MATTPKGFFRLLPLIDTQPSTPKGMIHSVSSPIFLAENSQALQKEGAGEALRADTYCLKVSDFGGCVGDAETRRVASQKLTSSITSLTIRNSYKMLTSNTFNHGLLMTNFEFFPLAQCLAATPSLLPSISCIPPYLPPFL